MKEQPNPITPLRQMQEEAQNAAPLERLILREGKTYRTNGESVSSKLLTEPMIIPIKSIPEKIGETYDMNTYRLIKRFSPQGANAYMTGKFHLGNGLPISYYRI